MLLGNDLVSMIYMIPILLLSVAVHECSHAYSAYKLGDRSQKIQGRMTLDPLAHIDIFGFISILLIGFGWGKPVYIDDSNFKNRNKGNMLVSLAGPLSNLILAVIFTLIFKILLMTNVLSLITNTSIITIIVKMLELSIQFNVLFAVFNMLPFPPFDGSKVLLYFLPQKGKKIVYNLEKYSFYILIILIITGAYYYIIYPFVSGITYVLYLFLNL